MPFSLTYAPVTSLIPTMVQPLIGEHPRRDRADVAEALDDDARALGVDSEPRHLVERDDRDAAAGRFDAPARAADLERLAGDDARRVLAHVHRVGVHDPRHVLRRRVDVGRGHVFVGPDHFDQLGGVAARDPFDLRHRERRRIAGDAALSAAERQVDDSALPGHPEGQRGHLVERDAGMEADAALGRAAREVVLHAIARVHLDAAVVALERDREDDLPRGMGEDRLDPGVEVEQRRSLVEVGDCVAENADFARRGRTRYGCGH